MKSHKYLYPKIYSIRNLCIAWRKARKGKTKKDYVIEFESKLRENLLELHKELKKYAGKLEKKIDTLEGIRLTEKEKAVISDGLSMNAHVDSLYSKQIQHDLRLIIALYPLLSKYGLF